MKKGIFVGLGGSGVSTLAHLKYKLLTRAANSNRQELEKNCQFIFVDTDNDVRSALNRYYHDFLKHNIIEDDEYLDFGRTNPAQTYWQVSNQNRLDNNQERLLEWMDERAATTLRNQALVHGAGGFRVEGRTAVWLNFATLRNRITNGLRILEALRDRNAFQNERPYIWVFSGSCGGTGSSAMLDVLYLIDREFRANYPGLGDPLLRVVIFMPFGYIQLNPNVAAEKYKPNAYAFLTELQAFLKDRWIHGDGRKFKDFFCVDSGEYNDDQWPLFTYGILVDTKTEGYFQISVESGDLYKNTAEMVFYLHTGAVAGTMLSQLDNTITTYCQAKSRDWVRAFMAVGYRALRGAEEHLKDYFIARFKYEIFKYGLLGKEFDNEVPRGQESIIGDFAKEHIENYVFKSLGDAFNLEREMEAIRDRFKETITDSPFKGNKGRYDKNLTSDRQKLDAFKTNAKAIVKTMLANMKEIFDRSARAESTALIERAVCAGVEEAILIYGLHYTRELVRRIDLLAEYRFQELQRKYQTEAGAISQLGQEIDNLVTQCVQNKGNDFPTLYQKVHEFFDASYRMNLIDQQMDILRLLSHGETGWIDNLERALDRLLLRTNERALEAEKDYLVDLPKRFMATEGDVTTTLLPRVHTFVGAGGWKNENPFAILYETIVSREGQPGQGSPPLRHHMDPKKQKEGLHRFISELLTDPDATNISPSGYYDSRRDMLEFFTRMISHNESEIKILEILSACLKRYVELRLFQRPEVSQELHKSLADRYEALVESEKDLVQKQFTNTGTQVFCQVNFAVEGEVHDVKTFYAGPDEALAGELGFRESEHQFVEDRQLNVLYRVKMYAGIHLKEYAPIDDLERAYTNLKNQKPDKFYPHMHAILNHESDLQKASQMLQSISGQPPVALFTRLLLYYHLFTEADRVQVDGASLAQIVFDLGGGIGRNQGLCSPLLVERKGNQDVYLLAKKVSFEQRKIKIVRQDLEQIASTNSLETFLQSPEAKRKLQVALRSFEATFSEAVTRDVFRDDRWFTLLDDAASKLKQDMQTLHTSTHIHLYADIHAATDGAKQRIVALLNMPTQ